MKYRWEDLGHTSYREYLRSHAWQDTRWGMLERFGSSCEHCGSDDRIHVHHFSYERLGHELTTDLAVLCWSCHADLHEFPEYAQRIQRYIQDRRRGYAEAHQADDPDLCLESEEWQ